ncbi:MAG: PD40 domain-containing protein, partial [Verrucomicrobia bacterium]|nr:PD40 domain-containing protein [Verrucomicrobiota bacterium]
LIALILLIQGLLRDKLAPRWRYALWLLVVVRLALPVWPGSVVSVFNFAKLEATKSAPVERPAPTVGPSQSLNPTETVASAPGNLRRPRWLTEATDEETELRLQIAGSTRTLKAPEVIYWLAFAVWAPVSAFLLLRWLWQNGRFLRRIHAGRKVGQSEVLQIFEECRASSGVRRKIELLSIEEITSPALYGVFRLRLLLPMNFLQNFQREELRHIFLHELAHVKRWDTAVNGIVAVLQMLHWFNPLVRLAFRRMALDRELACDEMALNRLKQGENQAYGATIIKLLENAPQRLPSFTAVGILEDYRQLLKRMEGISRFGQAPGKHFLAVSLLAMTALVALTDAQTRTRTEKPAPTAPLESITRTVILGPGKEADSLLSPDESKIIYTDWSSVSGDLMVKDLKTRNTWRLTQAITNRPGLYQFSDGQAWSRDSKHIAFTWWYPNGKTNEVELRVASADGREGKRVLSTPTKEFAYYPVDWSQDWKYLLAEKWAPQEGRQWAFTALARITIESGEVKVLADHLKNARRGASPRFSPDGAYAVFEQLVNDQRDIYSVRVADGHMERLTESAADDGNPVWSSDGEHILFCSARRGQWDLWGLPIRGGKSGGNPFLVKASFGDYRLDVSSQGKLVYYSWPSSRASYLIKVNRQTGEASLSKPFHVPADATRVHQFNVAQICYWRRNTLYLVSEDGKEEAHRMPLKSVDLFGFSRDREVVFVQGRDEKDREGIFTWYLDRKVLEPLLISNEYRLRSVTLGPKEVILERRTEAPTGAPLAVLDFETKEVRKLKMPPWTLGRNSFNAGHLKSFLVEEDKDRKQQLLKIYDLRTGETKVVLAVSSPERIQRPEWRWLQPGVEPGLIYTRVTKDGHKELRLVSLDSSVERKVPTGDLDLDHIKRANVSWDGSVMSMAFGRERLSNEMLLFSLDGKWQRKIALPDYTWDSGTWLFDNQTLLIELENRPTLEIGIIENYLAASGRGQ